MALPFDIWIDTELGIIHTRPECPSAAIPHKYGYLQRETVFDIQRVRVLDLRYKPCDGCKKALQHMRQPEKARSFNYRQRKPDA